jgi:hypothetical protein
MMDHGQESLVSKLTGSFSKDLLLISTSSKRMIETDIFIVSIENHLPYIKRMRFCSQSRGYSQVVFSVNCVDLLPYFTETEFHNQQNTVHMEKNPCKQ